jgi:hypothetical protein
MGIANREDANKYYNQVRCLMDEYMRSEAIRPSRLGVYMKPNGDNFNFFLKVHGLSEVNGIDTVLKDVIEDLVAMEEDGVMTFENFKLMESDEFRIYRAEQCLYKGIGSSGKEHEKALADEFKTSVGHVELIDADSHEYEIEDWEGKFLAVIYSEDEFEIISDNFIEYSYQKAIEMRIVPIPGVEISLDGMLSEDVFRKSLSAKLAENDSFLEILSEMIGKKVHKKGKWIIFIG